MLRSHVLGVICAGSKIGALTTFFCFSFSRKHKFSWEALPVILRFSFTTFYSKDVRFGRFALRSASRGFVSYDFTLGLHHFCNLAKSLNPLAKGQRILSSRVHRVLPLTVLLLWLRHPLYAALKSHIILRCFASFSS